VTVAELRALLADTTLEPHAEIQFCNGWLAIPYRDGAIMVFPELTKQEASG
jgi:hypothetical protein